MALLQKLKSILGLGGSDRDPNQRRDVGVTVEREAGEPDHAESSAGAGAPTEGSHAGADTAETTQPAGTDGQAPETETETETPTGDGSEAGAASATEAGDATASEPEATAASASETSEPAASEASETGGEAEAGGDAETADDAEAADDGDDLEEITGIGPAYAQRLRDAGVGSVAELGEADAEDLAESTDLSATRIGNWVEQADDR